MIVKYAAKVMLFFEICKYFFTFLSKIVGWQNKKESSTISQLIYKSQILYANVVLLWRNCKK